MKKQSQQIKLERYSSTAELTNAVIDGRLEWMRGMWELHNEDTEAPAWLLALCVFYIDAHEAARELRAERDGLKRQLGGVIFADEFRMKFKQDSMDRSGE